MKKKLLTMTLLSIMIISLTGCWNKTNNLNTPDKVAEYYCDILVKGNYGDILDIADLPKSEFINEESIKNAKSNFRKRFMKDNDGAVSCTYSVAEETDDLVSYKLAINEETTKTIDIKKSNNKVIIENISSKADIYSLIGSKVNLGGIDVSKYKVNDNDNYYGYLDHYQITILTDDSSKVESIHPLLTKSQKDSFGSSMRIVFPNNFKENKPTKNAYTNVSDETNNSVIKDYDSIVSFYNNHIISILKDNFEKTDTSKYKQYFVGSDTSSLSKIKTKSSENIKSIYEKMDLYNMAIVGEDKIYLNISYAYLDNNMPCSCIVLLVKDGNDWKIKMVTNSTEDIEKQI